jgi:hypothetical protein
MTNFEREVFQMGSTCNGVQWRYAGRDGSLLRSAFGWDLIERSSGADT